MASELPSCSIDTPRCLNASTVRMQSSQVKKFPTVVFPSAREPNITARWDIDLSPGTCSFPVSGDETGLNVTSFICVTSLPLCFIIPQALIHSHGAVKSGSFSAVHLLSKHLAAKHLSCLPVSRVFLCW